MLPTDLRYSRFLAMLREKKPGLDKEFEAMFSDPPISSIAIKREVEKGGKEGREKGAIKRERDLPSTSPPRQRWRNSGAVFCTVLYCTLLFCSVLYFTAMYCTALYFTFLHCTVLYLIEILISLRLSNMFLLFIVHTMTNINPSSTITYFLIKSHHSSLCVNYDPRLFYGSSNGQRQWHRRWHW